MTGSELAAITGLTSGAITGVVARLERAVYLSRTPDPKDGRKQILCPARECVKDIQKALDPIRRDATALMGDFDTNELAAIAEFLTRSTEFAHLHTALLRSAILRREEDSRVSNSPKAKTTLMQSTRR